MKRNWYLICTKKLQEKKVIESLTKKGIENYCPYTNMEKSLSASRKTTAHQPLFSSYVFVFISEDEITTVKKITDVVNMVYWKANPVIIDQDEIHAIRMMTGNYRSIKLEKTAVEIKEKVSIVEENTSSSNNQVLSIKHKGLTVTLPSLGYRMTAQRENMRNETPQEVVSGSSFLRRLNPLFLFGF